MCPPSGVFVGNDEGWVEVDLDIGVRLVVSGLSVLFLRGGLL